MRKRIAILSMFLSMAAFATFNAYAACPEVCAIIGTATGWCGAADSGDGDECKTSGTGNKDCSGMYRPLECAEN